ncbi:MAG: PD-(D/E)XK nuclease family protein [Cyanobacteria bacterium J06626_23]
MAYLLSATKLKSYARCPKAYYFRYECGLSGQAAFASAALDTSSHAALASYTRTGIIKNRCPPKRGYDTTGIYKSLASPISRQRKAGRFCTGIAIAKPSW